MSKSTEELEHALGYYQDELEAYESLMENYDPDYDPEHAQEVLEIILTTAELYCELNKDNDKCKDDE